MEVRACDNWNSFRLSFFIISYRSTLVVAKSQQRPLLFWLVTGPVLKSSSVLKTCASATRTSRRTRALLRFEWARTARASRVLAEAEAAASQSETLFRDSEPSAETGAQETSARGLSSLFSLMLSSLTCSLGLDGAEPMAVVDRWLGGYLSVRVAGCYSISTMTDLPILGEQRRRGSRTIAACSPRSENVLYVFTEESGV